MKKAILFLGLIASFLLLTSCTTDDFDSVDETLLQAPSVNDFNTLARDGEENQNKEDENSTNENNEDESTSTNEDDSTGPVIVIKKD